MSRSSIPTPGDTGEVEAGKVADPADGRERLDRSLVQGVAWTSAVKWGVQVVTWGSTIVVMRLLTPEDYGLVGMAGLFLGLVSLVSEFGLGSAVIALRQLSDRQVAQLNTVAVMIGIAAMGLTVAAAGPVSSFFDSPRLTLVMFVMSTTFLISALGVIPKAVLKRRLRYRSLALVEGAEAGGSAVVTLALAWWGYGYWSLVLGRVASYVIGVVAYWIIAPHSFARPRFAELHHALNFSSHIIASRVAWYAYSNADYLIIGKLMGQQALGWYQAAFTLSRMPAEKISGMVTRVTPGIFSAAQHEAAELRRYILIITEGIALTTFPPIIGLGLVAPELVPQVLGDGWSGAVLPLQILSVGAALRSVTPLLPQTLNVIQETRFGVRVSIIAAFAFFTGFYIGSFWGIAGVALAWVLLDPVFVAAPVLLKVRQRIGLGVRDYGKALWPATSAALLMAAAVLAVRAYIAPTRSAPVLLGIEVASGAIAYMGVLLLAHRSRLNRMVRALRLLKG